MPFYMNLSRLETILGKELQVAVDDQANSTWNSHGFITVNGCSVNTDEQFELLTPEFFTGSEDNLLMKGYQELFRKLEILPKGTSPIPILRDTPLRTKTALNQDEQNKFFVAFLNRMLVANQWTMLFPEEYQDFRAKIAACYGQKAFNTRTISVDPESGARLVSGGYKQELHQINDLGLWLDLPASQDPKDISAAVDRTLNNTENTALISDSLKKKLLHPQRIAFSIRGISRTVKNDNEIANLPNGGGHQHLMIVDRTNNTIYAINSTKGVSDEDYLVFKQQIKLFLANIGDKRVWKFEFIQGKSRQPDHDYTVQAQCNINQFISYAAITSGVAPRGLQDTVSSKVITLMYLIQYAYANQDKQLYAMLEKLLLKLNQQLFARAATAPVAVQNVRPVVHSSATAAQPVKTTTNPSPTRTTKVDPVPPALQMVIERLKHGTKSYNPYWMGSQNKLNKILESLARALVAGKNITAVLKDPQSELFQAVNMRRLPTYYFFSEPPIVESGRMISEGFKVK